MLTCYGHTCRLPRGDLTYLAFRSAALATIDQLQLMDDLEEQLAAGEDLGFLTFVPLLAPLDPIVQLDLLGEVWSRQRPREPVEATLLDAAVVYAACKVAEHLFRDSVSHVEMYVREGPRRVRLKVHPATADRFEYLFDRFWDDHDFLTLSEWQDLPGEEAETLKRFMRVADDTPLFEALQRGAVSSSFPENFRGLLTTEEIEEALDLGRLTGSVRD